MQARLVQHRDHFAEEHVDLALALLDNGVKAEEPRADAQQQRHQQ